MTCSKFPHSQSILVISCILQLLFLKEFDKSFGVGSTVEVRLRVLSFLSASVYGLKSLDLCLVTSLPNSFFGFIFVRKT